LPDSLAAGIAPDRPAQLLVSGKASVALSTWQVIPAVDAITHSVEVRAEIPGGTQLQPGQFATLLLPLRAATTQLRIPKRAVLRRSEVTGVYVIDEHGAAHLRQLRLGSVSGDTVSVLSGLQSGERIALDPAAAGAH
jgi:multidrug efflux pump subunit AcrA (membrane-fusion protein)